MTAYTLKLIAIITMFLDHLGAIFFPQAQFLRMIGRLAFPIFAFFIAEGAFHTKSLEKYILRMLSFAVLTELIFDFAFNGIFFDWGHQNVMWTFALALCPIYIYQKLSSEKQNGMIFWGLGLVFMAIAYYMQTDYDAWGVLFVLNFYYFRKEKGKQFLYAFLLCFYHGIAATVIYGMFHPLFFLQSLAAVSLILLATYNGQKGSNLKYFFYWFYPGHLLLFALIKYYPSLTSLSGM